MTFDIRKNAAPSTKQTRKWFDISEDVQVPGFQVELAHTSRAIIDRWSKMCTKIIRDPATGKKVQSLDEKALYKIYGEKVILDWRGLTVGGLRRLMPLESDKPDTEPVPYSPENAAALLELGASSFDVIVADISRAPANFLPGGALETEEDEVDGEVEDASAEN